MQILYDNIKNYNQIKYNNMQKLIKSEDKIKLSKLIKQQDKKLFLLSRYLLNKLIKENYKTNYKMINIMYNKFNKPLTNNFNFSISHKNDYAIACISNNKIGIDIEKIKEVNINVINFFCSKNEQNYILKSKNIYKSIFEIYCLKEAYIKMLGTDLLNIKNIEFTIYKNKIVCNKDNNLKINLIYDIDNYIVAVIEKN